MRKRLPGQWFIYLYLPLLLAALLLLLICSKSELHMKMNTIHAGFTDQLMKAWTLLGDGRVLAGVTVALLFVSFRHFFIAFSAYAFSGLGSQLLKRLFFSDAPRPVEYFEMHHPDQSLRLVEGVKIYHWMSFPSGHTAAVFALFFAMALMTRNRVLQVLFFCISLGVGVSRIYLSQHFLVDVVGGSVLGMISGFFAWWWFRRYPNEWMDKSLYQWMRR